MLLTWDSAPDHIVTIRNDNLTLIIILQYTKQNFVINVLLANIIFFSKQIQTTMRQLKQSYKIMPRVYHPPNSVCFGIDMFFFFN